MVRPTRDDLAHAQGLLEELASRHDSHNSPNLWPDILTLLDLAVWQPTEYEHAKNAAAYGPGGERSPEGGGTISHGRIGPPGLGRPVEGRFDWGTDAEDPRNHRPRLRPELNDPLVRDLRNLGAIWRSRVGQMVDLMRDEAAEAARWPTRTEEVG